MSSFGIGLIIGILIGIVGTIFLATFYVSGKKRELEDYDFFELTEEEKDKLKEQYNRMEN